MTAATTTPPRPVDATVVITTKDRCEELRTALASVFTQTAALEVLVIDDGSRDDTAATVARDFPAVRLLRFEESRGLVARRNLGAALASANIVISLDDDAYFPSPDSVAQTVAEFDNPRVGAVAIPYVDRTDPSTVHQRAPIAWDVMVAPVFRGTAYAVRRDVFLRVGGFRETIVHQGEERDFCIRLLDAGFVTRLGRADPIVHDESARRDTVRMDLFGRRNDILFAWHNEPWPYAATRMAGLTAKGLLLGLRSRRLIRMTRGLALGYRACWRERGRRRPVTTATARLDRLLRRTGAEPLGRIEQLLPR